MSDLISRQDAINALGEEPEIWNDTEEEWAYRNAWVEHISAIKSLPSADAVEVVRCKDCKHSHMTHDGRCKYCDELDAEGEAWFFEVDFFCAYGERREP